MASLTLSPSIRIGFGALFARSAKPEADHSETDLSHETRRAGRDIIKEMIWTNPDAFSSDLDVQHMLYMYGGKY